MSFEDTKVRGNILTTKHFMNITLYINSHIKTYLLDQYKNKEDSYNLRYMQH